jgi:hypothetical protein
MKKLLASIFVVLFAIAAGFSQSILDPQDSVYGDIRSWQTQGLLGVLPPLRPYPAQLVKDILEKIIATDDGQQSSRAKYQYERLFGKPIFIGAKAEGVALRGSGSEATQGIGEVFVAGTVEPIEKTSIAFDVDIIAGNKNADTLVSPLYTNSAYDLVNDPMTITSSINGYFLGNASAAYGTGDTYIQAGLNRSSWGDFYDGSIVVSPESFHSGNVTAVINRDTWNYTLSLFSLAASKNTGDGAYPEKFVAMHSITAQPLSAVQLTFFETMTYGKRFEPLYLLPVVPMMISQGLAGFNSDNLMMGVAAKVKTIKGLDWNTSVFMDDLSLNDLIKLKFNTKIKMAAQTGLVWAPADSPVSRMTLDYTIVMPYMYTHCADGSDYLESGTVNYQNYTNNGSSFGSQLPPNTDCVSLKTTIRYTDAVSFDLGADFIRHANVNESIPDSDAQAYLDNANGVGGQSPYGFLTDGSIFDYADSGTGYLDYAQHNLMFLVQDTKEYIVRGKINATWELPRQGWGALSLNAGYVCEYIINYGVDNNLYVAGDTDVAAARAAWKAKLTNVLNNYVTLGIKYSW